MKPILFTFLLLITALAHAESHEDLVDRAFDSVDDDLSGRWSYTRTEEDEEGVFVGHYDPGLPESDRWSLISVDGRGPTEEETEDYLEQRRQDQERKSEDDENDLKSIVKKGSVALLEETGSFWLFSFKPTGDTEEDQAFMDLVDGTLKIIKDGHYVALISLQNSKPIKPGKGIKIQKFLTRLEFAPIQEDGPVLPRSVQATVKGKAFLVVKFDETEIVRYSGYKQVHD